MAEMSFPCYLMYRDNREEWRWTYYAVNGEVIGVSSEGYVREEDCRRSVQIMRDSGSSQLYIRRD